MLLDGFGYRPKAHSLPSFSTELHTRPIQLIGLMERGLRTTVKKSNCKQSDYFSALKLNNKHPCLKSL